MIAAIAAISKLEDVRTSPIAQSYTPLLPHARSFSFSHQKIGIKKEDDKTHLDHWSPGIFSS